MSKTVKVCAIICITSIVICALITTATITALGLTAEAAIDTSFVLSGIAGIVTVATRPDNKKTTT